MMDVAYPRNFFPSVPFLELGQARRAVTYLCFSHSYIRYVISIRLVYLYLITLWVVCLCCIFRQNVLSDTTFIPWLCLMYTWSMGEPHGLTFPPYVHCVCLGCTSSLNRKKGLPGYPQENLSWIWCPCSIMWCPFFVPDFCLFPPFVDSCSCNFYFSDILLIYFLFFLLGNFCLGRLLVQWLLLSG